MTHPRRRPGRPSERGQFFAGYIIAILLIISVAGLVMRSMRESKTENERRIYRDLALNMAQSGFEAGLSYYRNQPGGVYLGAYSNAPTKQAWQTPWPQWPDAAFVVRSSDTDYYNSISVSSSLTPTAGGLVRTVPLNYYSLTPTAAELKRSTIWGRYVLRRQNTRNWSPGPNTCVAATDPEAVHDLTHLRGGTVPGAGNYWSVFSRGYVFTYPSDLTVTAAHDGNSLLNAPKRFYAGKRLLLATASVYGEISRVNFNMPDAAVFTDTSPTVRSKSTISGQGHKAVACRCTDYVHSGGVVNGNIINVGAAPSIAYCFPGHTMASLKAMAQSLDPTKVGGVQCFPKVTDPDFDERSSRTAFYFLTTTSTSPANTITFTNGSPYQLRGVGLVVVEGNLTIEQNNICDWSGVIFVQGNVNIRDRITISGSLIATGTVSTGNNADFNTALVEYDADTVALVQTYLQDFQVLNSTIKTAAKAY